MKKPFKIGIGVLLALLIVGGLIYSVFFYNKTIDNPEDAVGNAHGNINNKGYFCEQDGVIYFANAYDNYTMYSMNSDGSQMKKLTKVPVSEINVCGDHIYFYQTDSTAASDLGSVIRASGVYRCDLNGKNIKCLKKCVAGNMLLVGDYIYFQYYVKNEGYYLSKISVNGGDVIQLEYSTANPSSAYEGSIYYNGVEDDHYLYRMNAAYDSSSLLYDGDVWNPVYQNGYVYYMNVADHYSLCRLNLSTQELTVLTRDRVDFFAVADEYVYYQTADAESPALKRVRIDGTGEELVQSGVYSNINVTSEYVYFNAFEAPVPVYRVSAYGNVSVQLFDEAKQAAMKN